MAKVYIASPLAKYAEGNRIVALDGSTVGDVLRALGDRYPGLRENAFDEDGVPRSHVVLFVNNEHLLPRSDLRASVGTKDEIAIISAIAGG